MTPNTNPSLVILATDDEEDLHAIPIAGWEQGEPVMVGSDGLYSPYGKIPRGRWEVVLLSETIGKELVKAKTSFAVFNEKYFQKQN